MVGALAALSPDTTYYLRLDTLYGGATLYTYTTPTWTSTLTGLVTGAQIFQVYATSITANWAALGAAQGYELDASTSPAFLTTIVSSITSGGVQPSTLTVQNLTTGTPYYLRVGGLNWNGVANYVSILGRAPTPTPRSPPG